MEAHRIGQQLRAVVLRDRQEGRPLDPRRLQAVIGDLCGEAEQDLVPPLRHLVHSTAFASAAGMDPPLADGRQLPRLQNELAQVFAAPLCARLQPLLEGLLGLPHRAADPARASVAPGMGGAGGPAAGVAGAAAVPGAVGVAAAPAPAAVAAPVTPVPLAAPGSGGVSATTMLLAFLSGLLLMALAGVGMLLWQRQSAVVPALPAPTGSTDASLPANGSQAAPPIQHSPVPAPASVPQQAPIQETGGGPAAVDRAVGGIQQLYQALSAKDFSQAQTLYGAAAADQFDPSFFRQFERVTVQDLRTTGEVGSTVNLEGVVNFVWPDGSLQTETRSFSVDTSGNPAVITESEFGRVLSARD